jgi:hypothetical protein
MRSTKAASQFKSNLPEIALSQNLVGSRRAFCIELLGEGAARVFVRAVEQGSLKAAKLQRAGSCISASTHALRT